MKKVLNHIIKSVVLTLVFSAIIILYNLLVGSEISVNDVLLFIIWSSFFCIPLYFANAYSLAWVDEKFNLTWNKPIKKLLIGLFTSLIISLVTGFLLINLMLIIQGESINETIKWLFSIKSLPNIQRFIWITLTITTTFYVLSFIKHYQDNKLNVQKQKVLRVTTQHESLKSQIGPHFLFNSLNVLNGLIYENPVKAQEFVGELSMIYRYVLEQKDKVLVPLNDELTFGKTYMALIEKRYEDGLEFECNIDANNQYKIVPLSLQILLENCIKHNKISSNNKLKVKVYIEDSNLIVTNNLNIKNKIEVSTKKGLESINNLYQNVSRKKIEIESTQTHFTVKLPLVTQKIITMQTQQNYTELEYREAKEKVEKKQGFYWNLACYIIINGLLTFLDLRANGQYNWAYWPLIGWGIGILFHAIETFGFFNSNNWKNKQIQKELEKRKAEREQFFNNL